MKGVQAIACAALGAAIAVAAPARMSKRDAPKTCRKSPTTSQALSSSNPPVVAYNFRSAEPSAQVASIVSTSTIVILPTSSTVAVVPITSSANTKSSSTPSSSPVSAPAVSSVGTVLGDNTGKSSKMGISWALGEQTVAPVKAFFGSGSKVSWWWDWNKNYGKTLFPGDTTQVSIPAEFVPMLFDYTFLDNAEPLQSGYTAVQGWNEPDMKGMDPVDAASKWKEVVKVMRQKKSDVKLWSPAPAFDQEWMAKFLKAICPSGVQGCDVAPDYLNMRIYNTNVKTFKDQLTGWHDRFKMDIVVGEFACDVLGGGAKGAITAESVSAFMKDVVPWLESTPWVYRYSWFGGGKNPTSLNDVDQHNALMDPSGQLTPLGQQYVRGGV